MSQENIRLARAVIDAVEVRDLFVGHIHVRGTGSGIENRVEAGYVLRFRGGRAISFRPFMEPEEALATVGMVE